MKPFIALTEKGRTTSVQQLVLIVLVVKLIVVVQTAAVAAHPLCARTQKREETEDPVWGSSSLPICLALDIPIYKYKYVRTYVWYVYALKAKGRTASV